MREFCLHPRLSSPSIILSSAMTRLAVLAMAFSLAGCAAPRKSRVLDAATTPLSDLNLIRTAIPAVLVEAEKKPYLLRSDQSCDSLLVEIRALDEVLGPDFDTPAPASSPDRIERGTKMVEDAAMGAVTDTAADVVPFRHWVRKLTGAEKHSKHVAAAIAAGTVRRAFLKGWSVARGCS